MGENREERKGQLYEGHFDGLQEGEYIKAAEFKMGQEFTITIENVHREQLEQEDGRKRGKGIVSFKGKDKEWVSNKTNQICIAAMFGPMVKDWIGKRITLVVELVQIGPEKRPGFRVKGSPDIKEPVEATIKLPRRKPVKRMLVPTGTVSGGTTSSNAQGAA